MTIYFIKKVFCYTPFILFNFLNAQIQIGSNINGAMAFDNSGFSVSMPDNNTIAIGSPLNDTNGDNAGQVRIFVRDGNDWIQKGLDINGESSGDSFGWSLSMPDSGTIAIGAYTNSNNAINAGQVKIFNWDVDEWIQKGDDLLGEFAGDFFGRSVSMPNENIVAIGANRSNENGLDSGQVRVFLWNGSEWTQKGENLNGLANGDNLGFSVSMPDENTIAIGVPLSDVSGINAGSVKIFSWHNNTWVQKGSDIYGDSANDQFGWGISMPDANTVSGGAPFHNGNGSLSGQVKIFSWDGDNWVQKGNSTIGESEEDLMGWSLSMADLNTVAIGSPGNDGNGDGSGQVKIYNWNESNWTQVGVSIFGESSGDQSGVAVSMPTTTVVGIGANLNDGNGESAGHARIFDLTNVLNIDKFDKTEDLIVYPNPAILKLNLQRSDIEFSEIMLYNMFGQEVTKNIYFGEQYPGQIVIDISNLSSGSYLLKTKTKTKIIIKQ